MPHFPIEGIQTKKLNKRELNLFGKYWVKMYLCGLGCTMHKTETEKAVCFAVDIDKKLVIEVYVRTIRVYDNKYPYAFVQKELWHNDLQPHIFVAFVVVKDHALPETYLIPSTAWKQPNGLLVDRKYNGEEQVSKPEWGISVSKKNMPFLEKYKLIAQLSNLRINGTSL